MEKMILAEYADMKEEIKDLRKRIQKLEREIGKLEDSIVTDSVSCGKKGKISWYRKNQWSTGWNPAKKAFCIGCQTCLVAGA